MSINILLFSLLALLAVGTLYVADRAMRFGRSLSRQLLVDIVRIYHQVQDKIIDEKKGVFSHKEIPVQLLTTKHHLVATARKYQATPYSVLERIFQELHTLPVRDFTFVDYGCGMGRALLLAYECGYDNLVGIDINSKLLSTAARNLQKYPRAFQNTKLQCISANEFVPPSGNKIIFMFNPFNASMLAEALDKIEQSDGVKILVYVNPVHNLVLKKKGAQLIRKADHFHEDFSFEIYELPNALNREKIPFKAVEGIPIRGNAPKENN